MIVDKGFISINSDIKTNTQKGLYLKANLPYANLDDFMSIYSGGDTSSGFKVDKADIVLKNADLFDRRFNNLKIEIAPVNGSTKFKISSNETSGNLLWTEKDNRLTARLNALKLPSEIKKLAHLRAPVIKKSLTWISKLIHLRSIVKKLVRLSLSQAL